MAAVVISEELFNELQHVRQLLYTSKEPRPWESSALGHVNRIISGAVGVSTQEMDALRTLTEKLER